MNTHHSPPVQLQLLVYSVIILGGKMTKLSTTRQIVIFIETQLVDLLRSDWIAGRIANERDCEHRIYHHLTNVLDPKFIINANVTISGITTRRKSAAGSFLMPDLTIIDKEQMQRMKLLFELKLDPHSSAFPETTFNVKSDFRKLRQFVKNPILGEQLEYAFFVYLYKCTKWSERKISALILKKLDHRKLKAIAINRYQKKNGWYNVSEQIKMDSSLKALSTFRVGSN